MNRVLSRQLRHLLRSSNGATAIEYGMIAALVAAVIVAGVGTLGTNVGNMFNSVATAVGN